MRNILSWLSCSRFAGRILTLSWSLFRVFPILHVSKVGSEAVELSWWTSALNFLVETAGQTKDAPTYHLWDLRVSLFRLSGATSAWQETKCFSLCHRHMKSRLRPSAGHVQQCLVCLDYFYTKWSRPELTAARLYNFMILDCNDSNFMVSFWRFHSWEAFRRFLAAACRTHCGPGVASAPQTERPSAPVRG